MDPIKTEPNIQLGVCRCCLAYGSYQTLNGEHVSLCATEVYAKMLEENLNVKLANLESFPVPLICSVCILRLRETCSFRQQILNAEQRFSEFMVKCSGQFVFSVFLQEDQESEKPTLLNNDKTIQDTPKELCVGNLKGVLDDALIRNTPQETGDVNLKGALDNALIGDNLLKTSDVRLKGVLEDALIRDTPQETGDVNLKGALDDALIRDTPQETDDFNLKGASDDALMPDTPQETLDVNLKGALNDAVIQDTPQEIVNLDLEGALDEALIKDMPHEIGDVDLVGALNDATSVFINAVADIEALGNDTCNDVASEEEIVLAIQIEDEEGAKVCQLPSGYEIPIIKSTIVAIDAVEASVEPETVEDGSLRHWKRSQRKRRRKNTDTEWQPWKERRQAITKKTKKIQSSINYGVQRNNASLVICSSSVYPFRYVNKGLGCFYCERHFTVSRDLKVHTLCQHDPGEFKVCELLPRYNRIEVDVSSLDCRLCPATFGVLELLVEHLASVHEQPFNTDEPDGLLPMKLGDTLCCHLCDDVSPTIAEFHTHMSKHFSKNVCPECGMRFLNKLTLNRHLEGHERFTSSVEQRNKRMFACQLCGNRYNTHYARNQHQLHEHGPASENTCRLCETRYSTRRDLTLHQMRDHNQSRQYKCGFCPMSFTHQQDLRQHQAKHNEELQYPCDRCNKCFSSETYLLKHSQRHESKVCSLCQEEFALKATLRMHMRLAHGVTTNSCDVKLLNYEM